jgi:hypothetical protein
MSAAAVITAGAMCGPLALSATAAPSAPAGNPLVGLTADQIAKKAAAGLEGAASFHYHGSARDSGQTIALSLSVTRQGCTGSISDGRNGAVVILAIGKSLWLQPNDKFWEYAGISASELPTVQGKWIETTATSSSSVSADFAPLCNSKKLLSQLALQPTGLVKGKTTRISGHPALQLRNSSGQESIYVSISSKPEILRISAGGTLNFSAYGARVTLTPPPASDVITLPSTDSVQHLLPGI